MRLLLSAAAMIGLFGAGCAAVQIVMKDRSYYAWGYDGDKTEGAMDGYAFGMGGLEQVSYDSKEKILYGISEAGFITLIDYVNGIEQPPQLDIVLTGEDKIMYTDVFVCSEQGVLFASFKDDPNRGNVAVYKAATRESDNVTVVAPELLHTVEVGYGPDMILSNKDCTILAVANEGEGVYLKDQQFLLNRAGSISLIKEPFLDSSTPPTVVNIEFPWTDDELIEKGIHLPLSEKALEYWDDHSDIADDLNFSLARAMYKAASQLEPEYVAWSANEKYLLVSLQENSALVKINMETEECDGIYSYGLKSWEDTPIDIVEDDGCSNMPKVPGLFSVRSPDSIDSHIVGNDTYIIIAEEGDDVEYGEFAEKVKAEDVFTGSSLGFAGMTANASVFDPAAPTEGYSKYFNSDCEDNNETEWCASGLRLTLGSSMIDYSDPTAPVIKSIVALGGRGLSIYKLTDDGIEQVWDSKDELEREGCAAFPWAHNGIQDEEYADVGGTFYNSSDKDMQETLDDMNNPEEDGCEDRGDGQPGACPMGKTVDERSQKDGSAPESIVIGEACDGTYMATVAEKSSIGFLYDATDITSPKLVQVFHLSPASETMNPVVAYENRTLGEIDSESCIFLDAEHSPSGNPGILFAGAFSTTTSFWEFDCDAPSMESASTASVVLVTGSLATIMFVLLVAML